MRNSIVASTSPSGDTCRLMMMMVNANCSWVAVAVAGSVWKLGYDKLLSHSFNASHRGLQELSFSFPSKPVLTQGMLTGRTNCARH